MSFTVSTPEVITGLVADGSDIGNNQLVSLGDGKFVALSTVYNSDSIHATVFTLLEGVFSFGIQQVINTVEGGNNYIQAVYDKSDDRVVVLYHGESDTPDYSRYVTFQVSGFTISGIHEGVVAGGYNNYALVYLPNKSISVGIFWGDSTTFVQTITCAGGVLTAGAKGTTLLNQWVDEGIMFAANVGGDVVCASLDGEDLEFSRIVVTGTDVEVLPRVISTVTSARWTLGLAGNPDGVNFALYCQSDPYGTPAHVIIPGQLDGASNMAFGVPTEYEAVIDDYEMSGVSVFLGNGTNEFATFVRSRGDSAADAEIKVFKSGLENYVATVDVGTVVDMSGVYELGRFYNLQSAVYDVSLNQAVFLFIDPTTDIARVFYVEGDPANQADFWKNRTLQNEGNTSGELEKQRTLKVVPGAVGQPYIQPIPGTDGYTTTKTGSSTKCVRAG